MEFKNIHNQDLLLSIEQNTAYELYVTKQIGSAIANIEVDDVTEMSSKVRYAISYTFDDTTWSPYTTDFVAAIAQISKLIRVVNAWAKIKIKVICDFDDEHDYVHIKNVSINGQKVSHSDIKITELHYYRGITNQYSKNLLKPYSNLATSIDRMLAQAQQVSNIFGHEVYYIKIAEIDESLNATFKEFEKYKVLGIKKLKIVIPDNDFKANTLVYSEFNIEYEQDLEAHIVIEEFERAFGVGEQPEAKDIIYIPQIGRIYDVTSSQWELQLGNTQVFSVCTLKRHVSATDVNYELKEDTAFDINAAVSFDINDFESSMTLNPDDNKSNEHNDPFGRVDTDNAIKTNALISDANVEGVDSQKLHLYHYLGKHDVIRKYVHKNVNIVNQGISVNKVPIFYRYYDLTKADNIAIEYAQKRLFEKQHITISQWVRFSKDCKVFAFDKYVCEFKDSQLILNYNDSQISKIAIPTIDDWYFITLRFNNELGELQFAAFSYNTQAEELKIVKEEFASIKDLGVLSTSPRLLIYSGYLTSNIKCYAKLIDEDDLVSLALDKSYSVEDSFIIDACFDIRK